MTHDARLSALDTAFLRAERPETPLHVGAVSVFEGGRLTDESGHVRVGDVRAAVEARLHLVPRLRQVVREVPLWLGRPVWADDPHFDVAHHVKVLPVAKPGTREQLLQLAAELHEERLDRSRPLWELWLVEGLADGRVGVIEKVHHAMVDGVSGVDVAAALLDLEPDPPPIAAPPFERGAAQRSAVLAAEAVAEQVRRAARLPRPRRAFDLVWRLLHELTELEEEGVLAPPSSLNARVGCDRQLRALTLDLDLVRASGRAQDATINDVVLTAVGGGLRALAEARGDRTNRPLKVLVPVSLRSPADHLTLGNRVGALVIPLPLEPVDPAVRLAAVAAWTARAKRSEAARTTAELISAGDGLPLPTVTLLSRLVVSRQPFVNLVVTNVPGPPFPVYMLGSRMVDTVPIVPLGGNMTMSVGVLSYDGRLTLGVTADLVAGEDLNVFMDATAAEFDALVPATAVSA